MEPNEQQQALANEIEKLKTWIKGLIIEDPATIARAPELGSTFAFFEVVPFVVVANDALNTIFRSDLTMLPLQALRDIKEILVPYERELNSINSFSVSGPDAHARRQQLVRWFERDYFKQFKEIYPYIAVIRSSERFMAESAQEDAKFISGQREEIEGLVKTAKGELESVASVVAGLRDLSGEGVFAAHAKLFEEAAGGYRKAGYAWLLLICCTAGLTLAAAYLSIVHHKWIVEEYGVQDQWSFVVAKLTVVTVLLTVLFLFLRIYRASQHNAVVNSHRHNALATVQALAAVAKDPSVRQALLMQATHCIFSHQGSGFAPAEQDTDGFPRMFEIVRETVKPDK